MLKTAFQPPGEASLWESFIKRLEGTLKIAHIHPSTVEYLTHPKRMITVSLPVKMDHGAVQQFTGYRVLHNIARGPALGGVRFHPEVSLGQTCGMAAWMTLKAAVYNLPFGGSAGGVVVNPAQLSRRELERISRRYVAELIDLLGPDEDILAPDVGTDTIVMAWFQDTYTMTKGQTSLAAVTGKPTAIGGVTVKDEAGGQGLVYALAGLAPVFGWAVAGARMAIQGFGQVGSAVARFAVQEGIKVVAVSSSKGGIYAAEGFNLEDLETYYTSKKSFEGFPDAKAITNEELLKLNVEYLVPAAVEDAITDENAFDITAKVVLEGANGAVTPKAEQILRERGITVVPDVVANGGGLVLSYLEWVQDLSMLAFDAHEVHDRLRAFIKQTLHDVMERSNALNGDLRAGAYVLALERINEASRLRGVYP